jgi:hypothetical protein
MNREARIANRVVKAVVESKKTAGYSASGYYKSLAGWTSTVMKKSRRVNDLAPIILDDLQMLIDSSNKHHVMYNLGYLEGALDELIKDASDMRSVVVDASKAVGQHAS